MPKVCKPDIPAGFESMCMEWKVDQQRSAMHLISTAPVGWTFFKIDRKNTLATVTYIRPIQNVK